MTGLNKLREQILDECDELGTHDVRFDKDAEELRVVDHGSFDVYVTYAPHMKFELNGQYAEEQNVSLTLNSTETLNFFQMFFDSEYNQEPFQSGSPLV